VRTLLLDIETSPNTAYVWSLWKETIPLARLIESSEVLCWSAKWYGEKDVFFDSIHRNKSSVMLENIHELLDQTDAVVHYNGSQFDIPCLNKEFLQYGMFPPAPYKQIDLLQVARKQFRFPSNKLDYVANKLGLGKKEETNFMLWVDCMNGNSEAWKKMESYNRNDVILFEKLYDRFKPWIRGIANQGLYREDSLVCPTCGSDSYTRRGYTYTASCKYQRYQCKSCGGWFRGAKNCGPKPSDKFVHIV
jgi:hypothetical protein